jgi:hypothetical protein
MYSSRPQVQLLFVVAALIGAMSRMDAPPAPRGHARSVRLQPGLPSEA